jgi:hypothetical protein
MLIALHLSAMNDAPSSKPSAHVPTGPTNNPSSSPPWQALLTRAESLVARLDAMLPSPDQPAVRTPD